MSSGLLFAVVFISLGTPRATAHAWSLFDLFGAKSTKAADVPTPSEDQNSQTVALLQGASNLDPMNAIGGGDITMDNKALFSEVGPSGTMVDIEANDHHGDIILYTVRSGDTVASVAKMFDLSTNTVLSANDLPRGASLSEGQTLVILPVDGIQYSVKRGDTIGGISKKFGVSVADILGYNEMKTVDDLSVGDVLVIPGGKEFPSGPVLTSALRVSSVNNHVYNGYYANPIPDGHRTQGLHGNNAVDFGAPIGTPVYAAADGVVIVSNFRTMSDPWFGGYGNYIMIQHPNGTKTLYAHLSAVFVAVGAHVDQGMEIGEVGNTGHVIPAPTPSNPYAGAHLHFEVRGAKNPGADGSWAR